VHLPDGISMDSRRTRALIKLIASVDINSKDPRGKLPGSDYMATVATQGCYQIIPISSVVHLFQTDEHSQEETAKRSHDQSTDTISEGSHLRPCGNH